MFSLVSGRMDVTTNKQCNFGGCTMTGMWDMVVEVKMHYDRGVGHGLGVKDAPSVKTRGK